MPDDATMTMTVASWHATCTTCPAHTFVKATNPPPTQCAECLDDIATLDQRMVRVRWPR
jgi:hypothetical protein